MYYVGVCLHVISQKLVAVMQLVHVALKSIHGVFNDLCASLE
jgi:hypothetical protein